MIEIMIIAIYLILIWISFYIDKHFLSPLNALILFWSVFVISSLLTFNKMYNWNYLSLIWIFALCFAFLIGYSTRSYSFVSYKTGELQKNIGNISYFLIVIFTLLGCSRTFLELSQFGINVFSIRSIGDVVEINTFMAYQRYFGEVNGSVEMQILLIFFYAAPLCGGYVFPYSKKFLTKMVSIGSLLPVLLNIVFTNGKAGVIAAVILWISGYITANVFLYKKPLNITFKVARRFIFISVLILLILYLSMFLRIGSFDERTLKIVNEKFIVYAFGSIPAFDSWFSEGHNLFQPYFGSHTFLGVSNFLGVLDRQQGLFDEVVYFSNGRNTNVFTAFRLLIIDFGVIGSVVVYFILGAIMKYIYYAVKYGSRFKSFYRVILASFIFYTFYAFITSPWSYMSLILSFVIFFIFLRILPWNFKLLRSYYEK